MSSIQKKWPTLRLSELAQDMRLGKMLDKEKNRGVPQPYLRNVNVRWLAFDLSDLKQMRFTPEEDDRYGLLPGDLVICEGGEPGRAAVWQSATESPKIQKALHRVRFQPDHYEPKFAMYFLYYGTITNQFTEYYTGTTIKHLTGNSLSGVRFPVPPIREQRRIVAKIEELFSDLDAGVAALQRVRRNLKRYRASVLKAAVEGRLTERWRADHPDTEPADRLLERILTERRRKWEADQLAKYEAKGTKPPKGWQDKYKEPAKPDTSKLPKLPKGWCWATPDQVGQVRLGRQRSPKHHSGEHMRPYLRVANVFEDRIDVTDVMEMNFTPEEYTQYELQYGDILLNEGQSMELIGRPAMYRDEVPGACFTNTLVRFRPFGGLDGDYALRVFLAYLKNRRFQKIATITVNIAHLGAGRFSEIEFPLPPVAEQLEIVSKIAEELSKIDASKKLVLGGLKRASRLRQSILKRAFEGKLVPQDPADEPAEALLARIAEERAKAAPKKSSKPKQPRKPRRKKEAVT